MPRGTDYSCIKNTIILSLFGGGGGGGEKGGEGGGGGGGYKVRVEVGGGRDPQRPVYWTWADA